MASHGRCRFPITAAVVVAAGICMALDVRGQALPTLPQASVDTTYPSMAGSTISVPAGGNLQAAINNAQPGDTIKLEAGATFTGNFTLPVKNGTGWIVIRTSASDSSLPA